MTVVRTDNDQTRVVVEDREGLRMLRFTNLREAFDGGLLQYGVDVPGRKLDDLDETQLASVAAGAGKVLCVGHNYRQHILEMGHEIPSRPAIFSKFTDVVIGPFDPIELSPESEQWDWEAELAFVVSRTTRGVSPAQASGSIAGYTVANDVSARDWQKHSSQWLLGKNFPRTTPVGPWVVTTDEVDPSRGLIVTCSVDGVEKQRSSTSDLVFDAPAILSYLSHAMQLDPGDVVLTGTPAGVGAARSPQQWLADGKTVTTQIEGIGRLTNVCYATPTPIPNP
jgi:acylpyruvate hydrolase